MSAVQHTCIGCQIGTRQYTWTIRMIPWYRQVLSLVYGIGVMLISLWAIEQGQGPYLILGVVAMSLFTLMSLFGVEMESINVEVANGWLRLDIPFTETANTPHASDDDNESDHE